MKKLLFLLLFCAVGKTAVAQETVVFHSRDFMGDLTKLTVTFAPERRDCKVFWEYLGQKREYWVIDTKGTGNTQVLTVRYNYKDAILKRDGIYATLQWVEKTTVHKFGKETSFSSSTLNDGPNSMYVIQYNAQETGFYFINANRKMVGLEIDKDSPAKYWNKQLDEKVAQTFKLSHHQIKEQIIFTIQTGEIESMHIVQVGTQKYKVFAFDEN